MSQGLFRRGCFLDQRPALRTVERGPDAADVRDAQQGRAGDDAQPMRPPVVGHRSLGILGGAHALLMGQAAQDQRDVGAVIDGLGEGLPGL